ncbi:C2H2-like zinc finger protein [Raphanus sativus]|uniref:Uncharacterized protein LOC108860923 n=1 Tax=Raphanus sativus TaxID=3726 RepID=A0A6J0P0U0_RAPSA|nr:uncharacterized protein LOC108860923 [Raphanus sativus]KAJ4895270.1 C2H2-like zinc finger protein [Raphanus sativus]
MNGGFGMKEDLTRVSNHQECSLCKRIFLTLQDLISHINTFHSNHHLSTFSSSAAAAPTAFHQYPNLNRSPNPAFPARNCFDSKNYRIDHADEQGRFLKGSPARNTNVLFGQQEKPKLMNLFPTTPSEGLHTLPLLCQLETQRPQDTATEKGGDISSYIDLTLRL